MSDYRFDMNEALEQIQHESQRLQPQDQDELQLEHQQSPTGYMPQQHQFAPPPQWGVAPQEQVYSPFISSVRSPFASTSAGGGTPVPTATPTFVGEGLPPTPSEESYHEAHAIRAGRPHSSEVSISFGEHVMPPNAEWSQGTAEAAPLQLIQITPAAQTPTYPQVMLHHPHHESAPTPMSYLHSQVSPVQTQGLFSPSLQQQGYQVYVSPPQQQYQPMQDVYQPQPSQQTYQVQYNPRHPGQTAFAFPATPTQPYPYASPQPSVPMGAHVVAEQQRPPAVPGTGGPVRGGTGRASRAEGALPYSRPAHLAAVSPPASGISSSGDSTPRVENFLQTGGVAMEPIPAKGKGRARVAAAAARPSRSKKQSLLATTTNVIPNTTTAPVTTPAVSERRNLSPIAVREVTPASQAQSSARPQARPQPIAHSPTTPSPLGRSVIGLEAISSTDTVYTSAPASPSMLRDRSPISSMDAARSVLAGHTAATDDIRLSSAVRPQATSATSSSGIRISNVTRQRPIPPSPTSGSQSLRDKRTVATQTTKTLVNERLSQSPSAADRSRASGYRPYPSPYTQRAGPRSLRDSYPTQPGFRQIPMDTKYYYKTNTLKASLELPGVHREDLRVSLGTVFFNHIKYLCILAKTTAVFGDEEEEDDVVNINITHGAGSSQSAREAPMAMDPIGARQEEEESSQESKIEALEEEENEEEAALGMPPAEDNSQATAQKTASASATTAATSMVAAPMVRTPSASKPTNPARATLSTATTSTTGSSRAPGSSSSHALTSPVLPLLPRPPPIPTRITTSTTKRKREADDDGSADNDRNRRARFAEASIFGIPKPEMGRMIGLERRERRFGVSRAVIQVPAATTVDNVHAVLTDGVLSVDIYFGNPFELDDEVEINVQ